MKLPADKTKAPPKVIVYRNDLLPISETFIREQVAALSRWQPVFAGARMVPGGLELDGFEVVLLSQLGSLLSKAAYRICRFFNVVHPASVRALRRVDAELVHVHFGTDAVDIWPQVRALELPMIVTLHGYDINIDRSWWETGRGGWRRRRYPKQLLHLAQQANVQFIAVSIAIKERAVAVGIDASKIEVRCIGIDTERFRPSIGICARAKRIMFVGRLVEKKGVHILIRAFKEVREKISDAKLVILGDGPLRESLEQLARELRVPAEFRGGVTSNEVQEYLRDSRILCLPSITADNGDAEGFGMVLLEAQASGVPVVTSARGGAEEAIIDCQTGFAFAERDYLALASSIIRILSDDSLAQSMADMAVEWTKTRFDIRSATAALEVDYDRFVAHKASTC